ncbi:MAG: MnhB domain-containing protein [Halanaerobiales bacterium]|nr:MnhB domain-containing protein [Halanaerobiales bacterium]
MNYLIIQMITRLLLPYIQVYSFYIIAHGHLSPGGGFAGGAILGASMIFYALAFGLKAGVEKFSHGMATVLESSGALLFILLGLIGVLLGGNYLTNGNFIPIPMGSIGKLFSSGLIPIITFAIGAKVASTMTTLFYTLIKEDEVENADIREIDN